VVVVVVVELGGGEVDFVVVTVVDGRVVVVGLGFGGCVVAGRGTAAGAGCWFGT
jgi:hypothetical protein